MNFFHFAQPKPDAKRKVCIAKPNQLFNEKLTHFHFESVCDDRMTKSTKLIDRTSVKLQIDCVVDK